MLRHIVTWKYKDGFTEDENKKNALKMKSELEALKHSIEEVIELEVHINELSSSNMDIMLDSLFENEETLRAYKDHPEHLRVSEYVTSVMQNRAAFDYFE